MATGSNKKYGITLAELIITIVVIGILAAIAMPMFPRAMEATKAKEAVAALQQIRTAERVYRVEENDYWPSPTGTGPDPGADVIQQINNTIRTLLDYRANRNWDYSITTTAGPDTFDATATRQGGPYDQGTISIDEDGVITEGNGWPASLLPGQ